MTDQMSRLSEVRVALRITAPGLDPEEVTRNLELHPDSQIHPGDHIIKNPKLGVSDIYHNGVWMLESKIDPHLSLEEHIQAVIKAVDAKRSYIKRLSETATVLVTCVFENEDSFMLSPQILADTASLGATLLVTMFSPEDDTWEET